MNRAPFISGPEMKEPRSGNNRLSLTAKNRSHTNRPESDRTGPNPITNQKRFQQPIRIGYSEPIRSQHFRTNQILLVSNEHVWLVNFDQSKNYLTKSGHPIARNDNTPLANQPGRIYIRDIQSPFSSLGTTCHHVVPPPASDELRT